jgi:hypothetical protein
LVNKTIKTSEDSNFDLIRSIIARKKAQNNLVPERNITIY